MGNENKELIKRIDAFEDGMVSRFNTFGREVTRKITSMQKCMDERFDKLETDVSEIKDILLNGRSGSISSK